jgi:hypothetical protein
MRHYKTTGTDIGNRPFQVTGVAVFVGVDEYCVEGTFTRQLPQQIERIAQPEIDSVGQPGPFKIGGRTRRIQGLFPA